MRIEEYITRMSVCVCSRARERSLLYKHVFTTAPLVLVICVDKNEQNRDLLYYTVFFYCCPCIYFVF